MPANFFVGFDIAQAAGGDYSALAIIETHQPLALKQWTSPTQWYGRKPQPPPECIPPPLQFWLRHLERLKRGMAFHEQVKYVVDRLRSPALRGVDPELVIDATGVGRPVVELFKRTRVKRLCPITITGGAQASSAGADGWHVPKRDLVIATQILLQTGRLKIADRLPLKDVFRSELLAFKVKVDALTANDSYGAGSGAHDDCVLAVALAVWRAQQLTEAMTLTVGGFPQKARRFDVKKRDTDGD